jgi:hypothetical protein
MKDLMLEKSGTTPYVAFSATRGLLKLEGRSIPENPESFYESIITWIHEYFKDPRTATKMEVKLEYVNSGTSKYLMEIFRILKDYELKGNRVTVEWYYEEEDEAMYDLGKHYQESVKIPINLNIIY